MRAVKLILAGVVLSFATGAMAQTTWSRSTQTEDLLFRLDQLDAEIAQIRASLGGGQTRTTVGGGDVGQLEAEVRRLTAKVEQLENMVRQLNQSATNRLGDVEFRLNELEGVGNDGTRTQPLLNQDQQVSIESLTRPSVSVSEQGDLDRAIDDVNKGRFDQAEDRLRQFINRYPGSPLLGEAWYWLGESQSVRGNLTDAAKSYLDGYQVDRAGPKAPDNLYKLGRALGRLGQRDAACRTLREVRNQFPTAAGGVVGQADREARSLGCG